MTQAASMVSQGEPGPVVAAWRAWNWFWFRPVDPTTIGLVRICCGLVTLYVCVAYSFDLQELMGAHAWVDIAAITDYRTNQPIILPSEDWSGDPTAMRGPIPGPNDPPEVRAYFERFHVNPKVLHDRGYYGWSVWYHVTDPRCMAVIHGVILLVIFLFTIGLFTPVTSVLTWIGVVSYTQRAPTSLFGMDTMMNLLLIYLMVGQSGAALSIDRLIGRYRMARRALRSGKLLAFGEAPPPRIAANLGLRLIQVNLCIIYLASGLTKLQGGAWWEGTAVWGTISNPEFSPLYWHPFYAALQFLCKHRWLWAIVMLSGVALTLVMEIGFAFLVWVPALRWVMITLAVLMHTGIAVFMGLTTFSLMMVCMLLSFVPPEMIRRALGLLHRRAEPFQLIFDGRLPAEARRARLVAALDVGGNGEFLDRSTRRHGLALSGIEVRPGPGGMPGIEPGNEGGLLRGPAAWQYLARQVPLLRPVGWLVRIPGIRLLVSPVTDRGMDTDSPRIAESERAPKRPKEEKIVR